MKYIAVMLSAVLLTACGGGGGSAPEAPKPEVVSGCATKNVPYAWSGNDYTKTLGNYTVSTNTWNKQNLLDWNVCIRSASLTNTGITAIFDIDWPFTFGSDAVRSYTNVSYTPNEGFTNPHSWMGTKALDPIPLSQIGNLKVYHDIDVTYTGYTQTFYNMAVDPNPVKFKDYPPLSQVGINLHPLANSPQNLIDTIVVDGRPYWVEYWETTVDGYRHISLAFVNQSKFFKGTIPLKPFFDYIIEKNIFPPNYYMHTIQLGVEGFSGKGSFTINEFNVTK